MRKKSSEAHSIPSNHQLPTESIESNKSNIESIKRLWRISSSIKDSKQVMKPDRICLPIRPAKRIFDQN